MTVGRICLTLVTVLVAYVVWSVTAMPQPLHVDPAEVKYRTMSIPREYRPRVRKKAVEQPRARKKVYSAMTRQKRAKSTPRLSARTLAVVSHPVQDQPKPIAPMVQATRPVLTLQATNFMPLGAVAYRPPAPDRIEEAFRALTLPIEPLPLPQVLSHSNFPSLAARIGFLVMAMAFMATLVAILLWPVRPETKPARRYPAEPFIDTRNVIQFNQRRKLA